MAKIPYTTTRRGIYFVRICVPVDLLAAYKPKKQLLKSLKTKDHKEARKRVTLEKALIEAEFESRRKKLTLSNQNDDVLSSFTDHELIQLANKWFREVKAKELERRIQDTMGMSDLRKKDYAIELEQEELAAREELLGISNKDMHDGLTTASQFLKAEELPFNRASPNFKRLGHFFSKAIHDFAKQSLDEWRGKAPIAIPAFIQAAPSVTVKKPVPIGKLFDRYNADPKNNLSTSTQTNYRLVCRALEEVIGTEVPVHEVTRDHCREVQDLMMRLPIHATRKAPGKTLAEAAQMALEQGWQIVSPATFNAYMEKLSALMDYAVRETIITASPAKGLSLKDPVSKKKKRDPFNQEQLEKIFNAPLYRGCVDGNRGYSKPGTAKPRNARFWAPIIGLWTGMRLNEICQLKTSDISVINGVTVIRVEECLDDDEIADKRVKTEASIRIIPVHPMLKRIGFLDHVHDMKKKGKERLFPELRLDTRGLYSGDMSKWFSRFLVGIDAKTSKTSFHSFRHTFATAIRDLPIKAEVKDYLGGWETPDKDKSMRLAVYTADYPGETLYDDVCHIGYPLLDLSHLYV